MNEEDELQKLWDIGPRAHVATNFDFVSENEQMQILLKQEVLNQAEKLKCQIRYVDGLQRELAMRLSFLGAGAKDFSSVDGG